MLVVVALAVPALVPLASVASASPADNVEAARAAVDDAADRWFRAQAEAAELDRQIAEIEQHLAGAQQRAGSVREAARERALAIYKGASPSFVDVLGSDDALESARRVELIDRANEESGALFDELELLGEVLDAKHEELVAARDRQQEVLSAIDAEREVLEARLADAVELQRQATVRAANAERARALVARSSGTTTASPARATVPTASTPAAGSAPAPPAPSGGAHPQHDHPFLVCTRSRESAGNYGAVNPAGYYGAYQFSQLTWDSTANHAGRPELIGVRPSQAGAYDQDDLAWTLYEWQGNGPWGGRC